MPGRKDMNDLLAATSQKRPDLRRGPGYRLSTEAEDTPPAPEAVPSGNLENQKSTSEPKENAVVRVKLGYKVREDLLKQIKRVAFDDDRFVYEIMEDAFEAYLATRAAHQQQ
jgi:undecaprenyl pyrophosphate synthase